MTNTIGLWLPRPPSANNLFANAVMNGHPGRIKTKQYRSWQNEAMIVIRSQFLFVVPKLPPPYHIEMDIARTVRGNRDLDNHIKPIIDALVKAKLLKDDAHVDSITARYVEADCPACREVRLRITYAL